MEGYEDPMWFARVLDTGFVAFDGSCKLSCFEIIVLTYNIMKRLVNQLIDEEKLKQKKQPKEEKHIYEQIRDVNKKKPAKGMKQIFEIKKKKPLK